MVRAMASERSPESAAPYLQTGAGRVVAAVLIVGLLISALAGWGTRAAVRDRRERRLEAAIEDARTTIQRQLDSYAETLVGLRSLFAVKGEVSRVDFHDYVVESGVARRFPGARVVAFDRAVPAADRAEFEQRVRRDTSLNGVGYPGFAVHPDTGAAVLLVVDYLEPEAGNEEALGLELGADAIRLAAAVEARDSGELAATVPVLLAQGGRGFVLFLAVYEGRSLPVTAPARRRHLRGLVAAAFDADDILGMALGARTPLDVEIYDVGPILGAPKARLGPADVVFDHYRNRSVLELASARRRPLTRDLDVGSRRWRILAAPGKGFSESPERSLPWVVLGSGLALTALMAALVGSFGRSRRLALGLAADMTASLRDREHDLEDTNRALLEADRARTAFLSVVSHELQTPLAAITGFSGLLAGPAVTAEDAADYARRIARNAATLSAVIGELVDFTRLERDALALVPRPLPLSDVVSEVVDQLGSVLSGRPVDLDLEEDLMVIADPDAVTRVLTNLLTNAVKFSPPGSAVGVVTSAKGSVAELSVLDEGPGIPDSERAQVFDPFFRGSGATVAGVPGTGVGLAVVKALVGRMGGSVAVDGRDGGGARLTVTLPVEPPE
jgi:signal transduction histidine kinase